MKTKLFSYICIGLFSLFIISICDGCGREKKLNPKYHQQSSDDSSYEDESVSFRSEWEVRDYLCGHRFTSNDGRTMQFNSNANEVSFNGTTLVSYVDVRLLSSHEALFVTHGVVGELTYRLTVSGSDGVIEDEAGDLFYAR